ncbi:MAG: hypothetical protein ACD_39C00414G0001 [uncultured bacterium]|nr:MAG: hypothetical protein ACD_39C00414G0001 [uncultured bacterium]
MEKAGNAACATGQKHRVAFTAKTRLKLVAKFVAEYANIIGFIHPVLVSSLTFQRRIFEMTFKGAPAFAKKQRLRV